MSPRLFLSVMLLFVLLTLPLIISVGASSELWSQTYGGAEGDYAYSLVETFDGGYALAGESHSFGGLWLVKTDPDGNMMWNKTYGNGIARSLIQTSDGGYALAGEILPSGTTRDFSLVKTDAEGNIMWNQTYGGEYDDVVCSLVQTSDGGYALVGYTGFMFQDFLLIKTDADGNMQWNQTYGGYDFDCAYSLVEAPDGGYTIAGATGSFDGLLLVKTDTDGNMVWNQTYSEGSILGTYSLVATSDGGYAIAGDTSLGGAISADILLIKTDNEGNMEWNRTYGGTGNYHTYHLIQTSDEGYAIASSAGLIRTDAYGNMVWNQTYGGTAHALVQTTDGGYALAGTKNNDFWLAKTDAQGIPEFPSWLILPLFLAATFVAVIVKKSLSQSITRYAK